MPLKHKYSQLRYTLIKCSLLFFICPLFGQSIDTLLMLPLGGIKQAVLIRAQQSTDPILLRLHGGPGFPFLPYVDNSLNDKIEQEFVVAYWEQRGTGRSYQSNLDASMTIDQLIQDIDELVTYLCQTFNQKKVFIWGHSWGSNLGMYYIDQFPQKVFAYVGTGQSAQITQNERSCFTFALSKAIQHQNKKAIRQLNQIDTSNYKLKDALKVRRWINTYGGVVHCNNFELPYGHDVPKKVIKSPYYKFKHKWNVFFHPYFSGNTLWDEMQQVDLFQQVPSVDVPVYFFLGCYDQLVSFEIAQKYFEHLDATQGKKIVWFNESAHRPAAEEPELFFNQLLQVKKAHYDPGVNSN